MCVNVVSVVSSRLAVLDVSVVAPLSLVAKNKFVGFSILSFAIAKVILKLNNVF